MVEEDLVKNIQTVIPTLKEWTEGIVDTKIQSYQDTVDSRLQLVEQKVADNEDKVNGCVNELKNHKEIVDNIESEDKTVMDKLANYLSKSDCTSEEIDEILYNDDLNFEISEQLKEMGVTRYLYENEEYIEEIRTGTIICEGINVEEIKKNLEISKNML